MSVERDDWLKRREVALRQADAVGARALIDIHMHGARMGIVANDVWQLTETLKRAGEVPAAVSAAIGRIADDWREIQRIYGEAQEAWAQSREAAAATIDAKLRDIDDRVERLHSSIWESIRTAILTE